MACMHMRRAIPPLLAGRNGNNGYYSMPILPASSGSDVTLASVDYQTGPLGRYYYPGSGTNLYSLANAGSRTADQAGLYHHTTQTNQTKEKLPSSRENSWSFDTAF